LARRAIPFTGSTFNFTNAAAQPAQILFGALTGKQPVDTQRSDLWPVVAVCFGVGVVMLIILGVLGFFTADHVVAPNPLPPVKGK